MPRPLSLTRNRQSPFLPYHPQNPHGSPDPRGCTELRGRAIVPKIGSIWDYVHPDPLSRTASVQLSTADHLHLHVHLFRHLIHAVLSNAHSKQQRPTEVIRNG